MSDRVYEFTLTGQTALLMHADDIDGSDTIQEWRKDQANKNFFTPGDDRTPPWTWMTYLYSDGMHIALPWETVFACLRAAGAKETLKKQKTFKEMTQSGMTPTAEHFDFFCNGKQIKIEEIHSFRDKKFRDQAEAVKKLGFTLFCKRARIGQSKNIRVRARFESWSVKGQLNVSAPELTTDIIDRIFYHAGFIGLCDWRPGCKTPGPYGMFTAKIRAL